MRLPTHLGKKIGNLLCIGFYSKGGKEKTRLFRSMVILLFKSRRFGCRDLVSFENFNVFLR